MVTSGCHSLSYRIGLHPAPFAARTGDGGDDGVRAYPCDGAYDSAGTLVACFGCSKFVSELPVEFSWKCSTIEAECSTAVAGRKAMRLGCCCTSSTTNSSTC